MTNASLEFPESSVTVRDAARAWPLWKRSGFRFLCIYLLLQATPWTWFAYLPGLGWLWDGWHSVVDAAVRWSNARIFHVAPTLVPLNGSWDTSWAWAELWLYLCVAAIGCVVWSVLDRNRSGYDRLAYWLRTVVRYWIAAAALRYGVQKLFVLQMPFPSPSQLATPLGDLLPMRLAWVFVGYSTKYQFFAGFVEFSAGILLLYRRTVTLGLLFSTAAFANVAMLNLGYDVPVKLFSAHLFLASVWLLSWDARRLVTFLVLNRPAGSTTLYDPPLAARWQRLTMLAVKLVLVFLFVAWPTTSASSFRRRVVLAPPTGPFPIGVWDVRSFVVNGDTIQAAAAGLVRWRDVIFDSDGSGSVGTTDTLFWQRYGRGYFRFHADTARHTADVWRTSFALDSTHLFRFTYDVPDPATIRMWTSIRGDSVHVELARSDRHFQLTERQFHWLSEYNR